MNEPCSATKEMKESKAAEKMRSMANEYDAITLELEETLLAPSSDEYLKSTQSSGDFRTLHSIHRPSPDHESVNKQESYGYRELRNELAEIENKTST